MSRRQRLDNEAGARGGPDGLHLTEASMSSSRHAPYAPPDPPPSGANGGRELLTAEEVAHLLGMGVDWVWAQTRAGRIPSITLGRYRRYRRQAIDQWLQELEAQPNRARRSGAR